MAHSDKKRRAQARPDARPLALLAESGSPANLKMGGPGTSLVTGAFLVGAVIYMWLYLPVLIAELPNGEKVHRDELLSYLVLPDRLCAQWIEGANGEFALFDRLAVFGAAALLLAAACGSGYILLRCSRITHELTRIERFVLSAGIGTGCLSLLALVFGTLGWLHPLAVGGALGAMLCAAIGLWHGRPLEFAGVVANVDESVPLGRMDWASIFLAIPFALVILLGACLPPIEFDVREYHLQVPKEWYLNGHVDFLPHNVYGNMPLGAEVPSMLAMAMIPGTESWWWGALAGKVTMGCFAGLGALLLYAAGTRFGSPAVGAIAAVVYVSTPWIGRVSMNGLVEGVWGFYFLASFYVLWMWWHRLKSAPTVEPAGGPETPRQSGWGYLAVAGFLGGAAVACKYPALVLVIGPLVVLLFFAGGRSRPLSSRWGSIAIYLLAASVVCGPWFAKNAWLAGNPTYPLLADLFGGRTQTPDKIEQWQRAHRPPGYGMAQVREAGTRIIWQSKFLSPALIPLAACSLLRREQRRLVTVLLALLLYFVAVWWLFTHRIDRFLVPALPLVAWLAGLGACWSRDIAWRAVVFGFLLLSFAMNSVFFGSNVLADNRYLVPLRKLRNDAWSHIPAHRYFNSADFPGTRVLLVGDAQPFDLWVPVLYNTCFDDCIFEQLMQGRSASERLAALHAAGISHVYVDWSEIARYRQTYGFSEFVQSELFEELIQTGVLAQDDRVEAFFDPNTLPRGKVYRVSDNSK